MANGRNSREIKQIRSETLVALKVLYPAAMQADQLLRTLLVLFPHLEFDAFRRDLHYLGEKGYIERIIPRGEPNANLAPWRKRWLRLTTKGLEIADHCVTDPALEDQA